MAKSASMYAHTKSVVNNSLDTVSDTVSMVRRSVHIGDMKLERHEAKEAFKLKKFTLKHQAKLDQWQAKTKPPAKAED